MRLTKEAAQLSRLSFGRQLFTIRYQILSVLDGTQSQAGDPTCNGIYEIEVECFRSGSAVELVTKLNTGCMGLVRGVPIKAVGTAIGKMRC